MGVRLVYLQMSTRLLVVFWKCTWPLTIIQENLSEFLAHQVHVHTALQQIFKLLDGRQHFSLESARKGKHSTQTVHISKNLHIFQASDLM